MLEPLYVGDIFRTTLHKSHFPQADEAFALLLGTCAVESEFLTLPDRGTRQGIGYFQVTQQWEEFLWKAYLDINTQSRLWLLSHAGQRGPSIHALEHNLSYAVLLARIWYYWQDRESLPAPDDLTEQARHWRTYWRQSEDRGMEAAYVETTKRLVVPHYPLHRVRKGG